MKLIERNLGYEPSYEHDNLDEVIVIIPKSMDSLDDDILYDMLIDYSDPYPDKDDMGVMYPITSILSAFEAGKSLSKDNLKSKIADYLKYSSGLSASQADDLLAEIVMVME